MIVNIEDNKINQFPVINDGKIKNKNNKSNINVTPIDLYIVLLFNMLSLDFILFVVDFFFV